MQSGRKIETPNVEYKNGILDSLKEKAERYKDLCLNPQLLRSEILLHRKIGFITEEQEAELLKKIEIPNGG
jgi:hypothetical protein